MSHTPEDKITMKWADGSISYIAYPTIKEMPKFNWFQRLLRFIFRVK